MQSAWERERREKGNLLTVLLSTWVKVHQQGEKGKGPRPSKSRVGGVRDTGGDSSVSEEGTSDGEESSPESAEMDSGDSDGEDIVEDFRLSSESDESD